MNIQNGIGLEITDGIAMVTLNDSQRPVNVLSRSILGRLEEIVRQLNQFPDLTGIIFTSAKDGVFIAGADIHEIASFKDASDVKKLVSRVHKLFEEFEEFDVSTVAAINGVCLGGGLELAMACKARIASDDPRVRIGLPEVRFGIIPGFGGTQRLPRLVGMRKAIELITRSSALSANEAKRLGIVDRVVPARFLIESAIELVQESKKKSRPVSKRSASRGMTERFPFRSVLTKLAMRQVRKETRGQYPAALKAVEAVGKSAGNFQTGIQFETEAVSELVVSPISKRLIYLYFLQEQAQKSIPGVRPRTVRRVGVLGAGVMGSSIAYLANSAGFKTYLYDIDPKFLLRGLSKIKSLYESRVQKQKISRDEAEKRFQLFHPTEDLSVIASCDLVIEAVVEDFTIKRNLIDRIYALNPDIIFASNTSSLSISRLGENYPNVGGLHFFNPAEKLPLVEVVRGDYTHVGILETLRWFAARIGKTPIIVHDSSGFVINRVLAVEFQEAGRLVLEGAPIELIDEALEEFGMAMGPFRTLDTVGFDIAKSVSENLSHAFPATMKPFPGIDELVKAGFLGEKNQKGFWFPGGKKVNPNVYTYFARTASRAWSSKDKKLIQDRCLKTMVEEACRLLDEGVVGDAQSIDLATVLGMGFPPFRGGLLNWVDTYI